MKASSPDATLREKRRQDQARDGLKATAEYEAAATAMREKTAKLRALRLAREAKDAAEAAANPPEPVKKKSKKKAD
ncbi:MAG: hypothetical protein JSR61_08760 [Proteobacteria bacterium]|nr:hypothetical protein [Pseudomonadota bacterium]